MKQIVTLILSLFFSTLVYSQSVPSYVPTNGLVGWWGFNGNAQDASGNGNHGTVNGATLTTDRFGNQDGAYRFSFAGNRITTQSLGISGNNQRSVSVWISQELSNTGNNQWVFFSYGGGGSGNGFGINIFPSNIPNQANRIGVDIGASYVAYNPIISQNIWHHVVCTYSPIWGNYVTNCKIYLDGNLLTSVAEFYFPNTLLNTLISSPVLFGNPNSNLENQFRGKLDDIGFWNRVLTQQEITELYNAQSCQVTVTSQPQNQSTSPNRNVTFSLSSSDSSSTYQWESNTGFGFQPLFNAGQYSGVNTSSLTISNTSLQNNNQLFRCILSSNNCGRDTSDVVTLSVNSSSSTTNVPKRFNYQSVIRDTSGVLVTNRSIGLKVTLSRGPHLGDLYSETHQLTTNSNGLITSSIGGGTPVLGSMDSIDWSLGDVYIKTEVDVNGGTNYVVLNTNQLLSVPYSLYSLNSGNSVPGPVGPQGPQGAPGNDGLPGPQGPSGSFPPGTQVGQMNYWDGTNWVTLSPNNTGQYLVLCNGVPAWGCTPNVTTSQPSAVSYYSAISGGVVNTDGGSVVTARGVVYSTTSTPNLTDRFTVNGVGLGPFVSVLTNLNASSTYHVRAYATNSLGTNYGSEYSFTTSAVPSMVCGTSAVSDIDGNSYNTIQIGAQCWIKSNLKVTKYRNGDAIPTGYNNNDWGTTISGAYAIYNNDTSLISLYGLHYNGFAVNDPRGICPTGWHVPTDNEFNLLVNTLGGDSVAGGAMKGVNLGFSAPNTGATNTSGFSAVAAGYFGPMGGNTDLWVNGYFWSANSGNWVRRLHYLDSAVHRHSYGSTWGFSVRCLRDSSVGGGGSASLPSVTTVAISGVTSTGASTGGNVTQDGGSPVTSRGVAYGLTSNPTTSGTITTDGSGVGTFVSTLTGLTASTTYYVRAYASNGVGTAYGNEINFSTNTSNGFSSCGGVTDLDGNSYQTVQIGTQCWTQSNLTVSKYRNGDNIPNITNNTQWSQTNTLSTGAWCNYNNDANNGTTYGKLYNWYAVNDSRGLCPTGWHVPSDAEWNVMVKYLDPNADTATIGWQNTNAGTALKSTTGWNSNGNGTNSSGLTGFPAGNRISGGDFLDLGRLSTWRTSSAVGSGFAWFRRLDSNNSNLYRNYYYDLRDGFSVRCVRD